MWSKPTRSDELYHWGLKKGSTSKDHKYVHRIQEGVRKNGDPNYRYFYSMAEYKAYQLGQLGKKAGNAINDAKKQVGNTVKEATDSVDNVRKQAFDAVDKSVKTTTKAINNTAKSTVKSVNDTTNAVKSDVKKKTDTVAKGVDSLKKAFSKEDNIYNVNKKNYEKRKEQIQDTKEWKEIEKDKSNEYHKTDMDGNKYVDYDQYLVDKKHPILDALSDFGMGRKVSIRKQDASSFVAGVRDYIKMAEDTVQAVAGISIGILTFKIKKQQGSYKEQEAALKKTLSDAKKNATTAKTTTELVIDQITREAKGRTSNELANNIIDVASTVAKGSVDKNGKVKKPDRKTMNDAIDQVAEIAKSNAKTQAERDKIDLATSKAKQYSGMSKQEIKDDVIDETTKLAKSKARTEEERELIDRASNKTKEYSNMSKEEIKQDLNEKSKPLQDKAKAEARAKVRNYMDNNPRAEAGIAAYANEKGISYGEAKYELMNSPLSVIKKYTEQARR